MGQAQDIQFSQPPNWVHLSLLPLSYSCGLTEHSETAFGERRVGKTNNNNKNDQFFLLVCMDHLEEGVKYFKINCYKQNNPSMDPINFSFSVFLFKSCVCQHLYKHIFIVYGKKCNKNVNVCSLTQQLPTPLIFL